MNRRPREKQINTTDRWVISYADLVTLLFALFVALYAISTVDVEKHKKFIASLHKAFKVENNNSPVTSETTRKNQSVDIFREHLINKQAGIFSVAEHKSKNSQFSKDINKTFRSLIQAKQMQLKLASANLELELKAETLFKSGSAQLNTKAIKIIKSIAKLIANDSTPILVEGYTDNIQINNWLYASNWELSAARAASIVRVLEEHGIHPKRLSAIGYGQHYPIENNSTKSGRKKNRRVNIVIVTDKQLKLEAIKGNSENKPAIKSGVITPKFKQILRQQKEPVSTNLKNIQFKTNQSIKIVPLKDGGVKFTQEEEGL